MSPEPLLFHEGMHLVQKHFLFLMGLQTENFLWTPLYPGEDRKTRLSTNHHPSQQRNHYKQYALDTQSLTWALWHWAVQYLNMFMWQTCWNSSESRKCIISCVGWRQEQNQAGGEAAQSKNADLTFTVCFRCFSFSVCRSLRVRNPFATAVILSNFICISGVKTLTEKKEAFSKHLIKKAKNYAFSLN